MFYLLLLIFFIFPSVIYGTTATWNINANGNWNVNGNWTPATFPNGIDDVANFGTVITAGRIITLGQNITIGTINFNSTNSYTISGANTLTFGTSAGNAAMNITTGAHTISSAINLNSNLTAANNGTSNFTLSGSFGLNNNLTVANTNTGSITISGLMSGSGGITQASSGTGALVLSNGSNSYLGTTQVNSGQITYSANGAIPPASLVTLGDGNISTATLLLNAVMTPAKALNITLNSDGVLTQNSGATTYLTSLEGSGVVNVSTATAVSNLLDVSLALDKTYSGVLQGGASSSSLDPAAGNRIIKEGTATLTLTNLNTFASRMFIQNGIVRAEHDQALGTPGTNSGTFVQTGATTGSLYLANGITLGERLLLNGTGYLSTGALRNVSGNNTITGNVQIGWAGGAVTASDATIQVDGVTNLTINGIVQGSSNLTKTGTGTLTYDSNTVNTMSGTTTISAGTLLLAKTVATNAAIAGNLQVNGGGTLQLAGPEQISSSSIVTLNGGTFTMGGNAETIGSLVFTSGALSQGGATLSLAGTSASALSMDSNTLITGNIAYTSTGGLTYSGATTRATLSGDLSLANSAHTFTIADGTDSVDMEISGAITSTGGSGAITKSGAGTLAFTGSTANTYTGSTTVNGGELFLNKTGVNSVGGDLTINSGTLRYGSSNQVADSAIVTLGGGTLNMGGFNDTISRLVFNSGTTSNIGTLTLSNASTALSMGSATSLTGDLVLTGAGNLTFNGVGAKATLGGTLALGASTHTISTTEGTDSTDFLINSAISGIGGLTISGPSSTAVTEFGGSVANSYSGTTTITQGTLLLNKSAGNAIVGTINCNTANSNLRLGAANQIGDSSALTLALGSFDMQGFNESLGSFTYNSGTFTQGGGILTCTSAGTALSMRNTTISGNVVISNGGTVTFDATSNNTAVLSGNVQLDAITPFSIANGTATTDMLVSGTMSGLGGVTKSGTGQLEFSGAASNTYAGLTTVTQGTLSLNKTAGINAIPGNLLLSGGTLSLATDNQISNSALMTLSGGTFSMSTFAETLDSLVFNSGTLSQSSGVLTLQNAVTPLTMRNTTIAGSVALTNGGSLVFDPTSNGTATLSGTINLGTIADTTFDVGNGSATTDMQVSGVIQGNRGINKIGAGQLQFSGASANTYSGLTTVTVGTLSLNKTAGINAIPGNLLLSGGSLSLAAANQISDSALMTLSGGTFSMGNFAETLDRVVFNSGSLTQGSGVLTLQNASTPLTMRNTTIAGSVTLTNGGSVVFDSTNNGTATLSGTLNIGTIADTTFDVADGSALTDMQLSGAIQGNRGINKIGSGQLEFSGASANTYTGLTTVTLGTLSLNKTANINAIPGDLLLNGGTLTLAAANQINNSALMTLSGGTFSMGNFAETLDRVIFNSGSLTQGLGVLTLQNAVTPLTMRDTTIGGTVTLTNGGSVVFDSTNNGTAILSGTLNLGSIADTTFNVADGSALIDMSVSGQIQGNRGINKIGSGQLEFSGASANTYAGLTTVTTGSLSLNKTSGINAISGNVLLTGGNLSLAADNQINDSSVMTLSGGTFSMGNFAETLDQMIFNSGSLTQGLGVLTLQNAVTPLTMRDTTIGGTVTLTNGGSVVFDSTNNGTAILSGTLNLGSIADTTFNVADGSALTDMSVSGQIQGNRGINKIGSGQLEFSGASANTYSGLTTVTTGTLSLNKTSGINAIPGNVLLSGGTLSLAADNQINDSSVMTLSGGTFSMGNFAETLDQVIFNSGSLTQGLGVLTLQNAATPLTMRDTTIAGAVTLTNGGSVVFDSTNNGTATLGGTLNLGTIADTTFDIADGSAITDMLVSGVIQGGQGINKIGVGQLEFSGASANTYTGLTTVTMGTLALNKTAGMAAISGDVMINGGTLLLSASNQINDGATMTLSTGTFNMGNFSESYNSLFYNGGSVTQGSGILSLQNLTMRDTTLAGTVHLINGGNCIFDPANNGMATISGALDLGATAPTFIIGDGSSVVDMLISGPVTSTGVGFTKTGLGTLELSNAVTLNGLSTVDAGILKINGTFGGTNNLVINAGSTLEGTGTINKNLLVYGKLHPGNSIGTIHVVGNETMESGSILEIEVDPTSISKVEVTGTYTIQPNSIVNATLEPGLYATPFVRSIVHASGGIVGTFASLNIDLPLFTAELLYDGDDVFFGGTFSSFSSLFPSGNAGAVARSLDQVVQPPGSDIESVINVLQFIPTVDALEEALLQLQPSAFTSLSVTSENNALYVNQTIANHLEKRDHFYCLCRECCEGCELWFTPLMAYTKQNTVDLEPGYKAISPGFVLGWDHYRPSSMWGVAVGYTYTNLKWEEERGRANCNSLYAALYGRKESRLFYVESSLIGSYNMYATNRYIDFASPVAAVQRNAKGHHDGFEIMANFKGGLLLQRSCLLFSPYYALNAFLLHENGFCESGADSLNLSIDGRNSTLVVNEMGIDFSRPFCCNRYSTFVELGVVRESRFSGASLSSIFAAQSSLYVEGLYPSRTLGSLIVGIEASGTPFLSLFYRGRYGSSFQDHSLYFEWSY